MSAIEIHIFDKMAQPIGRLKVDSEGYLAECGKCFGSFSDESDRRAGGALEVLLSHFEKCQA